MNEWQLIGYLEASIEDALRLMSRQPAVARQRLTAALAKVKAEVDRQHAESMEVFRAGLERDAQQYVYRSHGDDANDTP